MNEDERKEFDAMKATVDEMAAFIRSNFNPDGTPKVNSLVVESEDTTTVATGSIRINTNLGPKNILIA